MRRGEKAWMGARLLVALAFFASFVLRAQTQGEITRVVTDQSGAVVAGAIVSVTNPQTGFSRQIVTTGTGNYVFPTLLPGTYNIKVEKPGFQTAESKGIDLQVNQVARIDFPLRIGAVAETVEVTGGAPRSPPKTRLSVRSLKTGGLSSCCSMAATSCNWSL